MNKQCCGNCVFWGNNRLEGSTHVGVWRERRTTCHWDNKGYVKGAHDWCRQWAVATGCLSNEPKRGPDETSSGDLLDAPCVFCSFSGAGYWQTGSHSKNCPWYGVGGAEKREDMVRSVVNEMWRKND